MIGFYFGYLLLTRETTITISDSTGEPVSMESEIVTVEISEKTRFSGSGYREWSFLNRNDLLYLALYFYAAALYLYSVLKSGHGSSHIVCWVPGLFISTQSVSGLVRPT